MFANTGQCLLGTYGDMCTDAALHTDTRAYWNLTRNLYRFAPTSISELPSHPPLEPF